MNTSIGEIKSEIEIILNTFDCERETTNENGKAISNEITAAINPNEIECHIVFQVVVFKVSATDTSVFCAVALTSNITIGVTIKIAAPIMYGMINAIRPLNEK